MKLTILSLWAHKLFDPLEPQPFGGAELQLVTLARELARRFGVTVQFVTRGAGERREFETGGIHVVKLPYRKTGLARMAMGTVEAYRALRSLETDVYLQRCGGIETGITARAAVQAKKPFLFMTSSAWDMDGTHARARGRLYGQCYLYGLRHAAGVICQSRDQQQRLHSDYGVNSLILRSAHAIPDQAPEQKEGVLWVGRCEPVKNPEMFLQTAKALPNIPCTMICPPANSREMFERIQEQATGMENLTFLPGVSYETTETHFARHRLFVCTSEKEGFPNTYIQALKWGTPVVSFNVNPDGILEQHAMGWCAGGDAARQQEFIQQLYFDETQWDSFSRNARKYAQAHHDLAAISNTLYEWLKHLIAESRLPAPENASGRGKA